MAGIPLGRPAGAVVASGASRGARAPADEARPSAQGVPMRRARALLLALPALLAVASAAHAAGVSLRWNDCYGDGGVQNKNFACDTNAGSQTLVGSFTLDRKSTRLNSSHVEISYAVFCLKKKKKKE